MTGAEIREYCLGKPHAYEGRPFGTVPVCFRVKSKIFAQLYPDKLTLKRTAFSGQLLLQAYIGLPLSPGTAALLEYHRPEPFPR